jgi:hypothetical protein
VRVHRLCLLALLAGCPGGANHSDTGSTPHTERRLVDLPPGTSPETRPKPDLPVDLCAAFSKEGQACTNGACVTGLVPAVLGSAGCACYAPCNPDQGKRCQPQACDRICVQLTDAGKPLPGQGACVQDKGNAVGEPCSPAVCKVDLQCMLQGTVSFCRQICTGAADCLGYQMVCVPMSSGSTKICIPGGATVGPKLGESCAAATAYCVDQLLCDPQSKTCLKPCSPTSGCTSGTCTKLTDTATGVVIGYGCR